MIPVLPIRFTVRIGWIDYRHTHTHTLRTVPGIRKTLIYNNYYFQKFICCDSTVC